MPTPRRRNLKTHQIFQVHSTRGKIENTRITGHFEFIFEENSDRVGNHRKSSLFKMFYVYNRSAKQAFSKFSGLLKLRFRDGLGRTEGPEIDRAGNRQKSCLFKMLYVYNETQSQRFLFQRKAPFS